MKQNERPKSQGFSLSLSSFFTNEDDDNDKENNGKVHCDNVDDKEDDGNDHNDDDDLHGFLLMIGLLKESAVRSLVLTQA